MTNQIARFQNFEFSAKNRLKRKLVDSVFEYCIWNRLRYSHSWAITFQSFSIDKSEYRMWRLGPKFRFVWDFFIPLIMVILMQFFKRFLLRVLTALAQAYFFEEEFFSKKNCEILRFGPKFRLVWEFFSH